MNKKVFISGSISIKRLPKEALKSIGKIISKKFEILVGDAKGVDSLDDTLRPLIAYAI